MAKEDRELWDRRYRDDYSPPAEPSPLLERYIQDLQGGRALDVATGTGRNAVFLADNGFDVEAIDISRVALSKAREIADRRSVDVDWIQADLDTFEFPTGRYDVIMVDFFYFPDRLADLFAALEPGGLLCYEHGLKMIEPIEHGPSNRYRFDSNELLHFASDYTVLYYEECTDEIDGNRTATARLVARNSTGRAQRYPRR